MKYLVAASLLISTDASCTMKHLLLINHNTRLCFSSECLWTGYLLFILLLLFCRFSQADWMLFGVAESKQSHHRCSTSTLYRLRLRASKTRFPSVQRARDCCRGTYFHAIAVSYNILNFDQLVPSETAALRHSRSHGSAISLACRWGSMAEAKRRLRSLPVPSGLHHFGSGKYLDLVFCCI